MMPRLPWMLFSLLVVSTSHKVSSLTFEAYPSEIKADLTHTVAMTCKTSGSSTFDVRRVTSIFINRQDGTDVASITTFDPATAISDLGNMEVKGSLSATSSEGSLELSWKDPSKMTLGGYTCFVNGIDRQGHPIVLTGALQMTSVAPSISDVIVAFNAKLLDQQQQMYTYQNQPQQNVIQQQTIQNLTLENAKQQQQIESQQQLTTTHQTQITSQQQHITSWTQTTQQLTQDMSQQQHLLTIQQQTTQQLTQENAQQKQQIESQQQLITNQQHTTQQLTQEMTQQQQQMTTMVTEITNLKLCSAQTVAFTATFAATGNISFTYQGTVKFDQIILNEGNAYDGQTGTFTCATSGIYSFNLHTYSYPTSDEVCLKLRLRNTNGVNTMSVTSLMMPNTPIRESASTGAVIRLQQGDFVSIESCGPSRLYQDQVHYWQANIFTGHLVKADSCVL